MNSTSPPSPEQQLCLFAKYWLAGSVKTRLGVDIGMQRAATLQRIFVHHLSLSLQTTPLVSRTAAPLLATAPDEAVAELSEIFPFWSVCGQGPGDLGQRLQRLFQHQLTSNRRLVVIGADCPDLPPATVIAAWQCLATADAVIGPASDGGYYLLGLSGPWQPWMATLFNDMAWSQADVADRTRRRIAQANRSLTELEIRDDVDTLTDLRKLALRLAASKGPASGTPVQQRNWHLNQQLLAAITAIVPEHVTAGANQDTQSQGLS